MGGADNSGRKVRIMAWSAVMLSAAMLAAPISSGAMRSEPMTLRYEITSRGLGSIGTYVRTIDQENGLDRAQSQLRIQVRMMGIPVFRERADQIEEWRDGRLVEFRSVSTANAKPLLVHAELRDGRLLVTTPEGAKLAPAGAIPADPWFARQLGPATVVTIKTGRIMTVDTTGGEPDLITVDGVPTLTHHFHVNTQGQANWWEIWVDARGVPVKFRSQENGRQVDFNLTATTRALASNPTAVAR